MSHYPPTPEQQDILAAFRSGSNLVVQAGAGTGKTSTIELLADDMAQRGMFGIYITLNKSVAQEIGARFSAGNIASGTIHSLAFQIANMHPVIAPLVARLGADNSVTRMAVARHLGVEKIVRYTTFHQANRKAIGLPHTLTTISSLQLTHAALRALQLWCQTDHDDLTVEHVERPATMPPDQFDTLYAPEVVKIAIHAWTTDILSPNGRLPFTHDYYLKLVSMARPQFTECLGLPPGSVIFFDEGQDSRPCVTGMLHAQQNMQLVVVGDSAQAIYGFTGARDALPRFSARPGTVTLPLTTSWRFGPAIADAANTTLDVLDAPIRLTGNPALTDSRVEIIADDQVPNMDTDSPDDTAAILVRTNAQLIIEAKRQIDQGRTVALVTDIGQLWALTEDFERIEQGHPPRTAELREFTGGIDQITEYVNDDTVDAGNALKTLLGRFLTEGIGPTRGVIMQCVPEADADITVSTIHKSKGRQWNSVYLALDPEDIVPGISPHIRTIHDGSTGQFTGPARDALMLFYVAATRARDRLIIRHDTDHELRELYAAHRTTQNAQGHASALSALSAVAANSVVNTPSFSH